MPVAATIPLLAMRSRMAMVYDDDDDDDDDDADNNDDANDAAADDDNDDVELMMRMTMMMKKLQLSRLLEGVQVKCFDKRAIMKPVNAT